MFSALFSMLPESKSYLKKDEWDDSHAGLIMMGCFICGFVGIQVISRLLHQVMPSHVVDCDHSHSHDDVQDDHKHSHAGSRQPSRVGRPMLRTASTGRRITTVTQVHPPNGHVHHHGAAAETTPLIGQQRDSSSVSDNARRPTLGFTRRSSLMDMRQRVMSFVKDTKSLCDEGGPCYGYSDPCGQECFKHVSSRGSMARQSSLAVSRTRHSPFMPQAPLFERVSEANSEDSGTRSPMSPRKVSRVQSRDPPTQQPDHAHGHGHNHGHDHDHDQAPDHDHQHEHAVDEDEHPCDQFSEGANLEAQDAHHHHVPTNAFMSISLQTTVAIALHKFPEGFITYATNHANPQLGFNVFMALFVHNIAEGFVIALPLYMAIGSRVKAIAWSSLLGGLSQPVGAAIAWLVFKFWGSGGGDETVAIDSTAYAALFAATAGIMTSVALQLFVESLSLNHNRNLAQAFAFLGMVLMGLSGAIAGHSH